MIENPYFSYTKRDYEGSRKEGLAKIPILSNGKWTDLNATDPGIIILDYVHAIVDMMNYYQDHQALEVFLPTAKERENVFRIAKQLSYKIRSAKGATVDVSFSTLEPYDYPIKIPKYTALRTVSGIVYLTKGDYYIPAGSTRVVIPCTQGEIEKVVYKGTGASRFTEEAHDQSYKLLKKEIDIDSITITDDLGKVWKKVDYIVFSTANERVFETDLLYDDTIEIKFGSGERGYVPQPTDNLTISYIVTKGSDGAIGAGEISALVDEIFVNGTHIPFIVTNNYPSIGGSESQSTSDIKELAPGVIKAQDRAVTLLDFENLAKNVEGVRDAKAYDINILSEILNHEVKVLIIPEDSYIDSIDALKDKVHKYLYDRMIPPTVLYILTPKYVPIDISVSVKTYNNQDIGSIEYAIRKVVTDYFNNRTGIIGENFYPAELSAEISSLEEVRYVTEIYPPTQQVLEEFDIATLGSLTINIE